MKSLKTMLKPKNLFYEEKEIRRLMIKFYLIKKNVIKTPLTKTLTERIIFFLRISWNQLMYFEVFFPQWKFYYAAVVYCLCGWICKSEENFFNSFLPFPSTPIFIVWIFSSFIFSCEPPMNNSICLLSFFKFPVYPHCQ